MAPMPMDSMLFRRLLALAELEKASGLWNRELHNLLNLTSSSTILLRMASLRIRMSVSDWYSSCCVVLENSAIFALFLHEKTR